MKHFKKPKPNKQYLESFRALYAYHKTTEKKMQDQTKEVQNNQATEQANTQENPFIKEFKKIDFMFQPLYKEGVFECYNASTKTKYEQKYKYVDGQIISAYFILWRPTTPKEIEAGATPAIFLKLKIKKGGKIARVDFRVIALEKDGEVLTPTLFTSGLNTLQSLYNLHGSRGEKISLSLETSKTAAGRTVSRTKCFINDQYNFMTRIHTDEEGNKTTINQDTSEAYRRGIRKQDREIRNKQIFNDICDIYGLTELKDENGEIKGIPADVGEWLVKIDTTPPQQEQEQAEETEE